MTSTPVTSADIVHDACLRLGVPGDGAAPLRQHATSVWILPEAHAVARLAPADRALAMGRGVAVARRLVSLGFPATEPLAVDPNPTTCDGWVVSFWRHYPQPSAPPPPSALGQLLRELHELPPPSDIPAFSPLTSLTKAITGSPVLRASDRAWLLNATREVQKRYESRHTASSEEVLLHGDAYPGNLMWDGRTPILGDWDEVARGPRSVDLAPTIQGRRFGRSESDIAAFIEAYGSDPQASPGFATMIRARDLHTLGTFIRRAETDSRAEAELRHRIGTLTSGASETLWNRH